MSGPGFFAGTLFGGVVGAAAALLLAPKSGQETRRELAAHRTRPLDAETAPAEAGPSDLILGAVAAAEGRLERAIGEARLAAAIARADLTREWEARKAGRR